MPYGMCVAGGAVAGVISMAVLVHSETPRATPHPVVADVSVEANSPAANLGPAEKNRVLLRNANVMFDSAHPDQAADPFGVRMPIGEFVNISLANRTTEVTGRLESSDVDWLQVVGPDGNRTWVAKRQVVMIAIDQRGRTQ